MLEKVWARIKKDGLSRTVRYARHWVSEKYHERALGIRSAGIDRPEEHAAPDLRHHQPIDYRSLIRTLKRLDVRPGRDVFLDYGSGKGRVIVVAATYPWRRVIGVELCETLHAIASENIERARAKFKCDDVLLVRVSAVEYEVPDDVTVVLVHNSLGGDVLDAVRRRILESLERAPRFLTVIYRFPGGATDAFRGRAGFALRDEVPCWGDARERMLIYESHPDS